MILKRFNVTRQTEDPAKAKSLIEEGYVLIKDKAAAPPEPEKPGAEEDLTGLTKAELVKIAEQRGIKGARSLTKANLLEVLI